MAQRLDKIKADLEAAKEKRAWWDNRIRYLEKKLSDEEKTIVHDIVKAADLTPEELAQVIAYAKKHLPGGAPITATTDETKEEIDEE